MENREIKGLLLILTIVFSFVGYLNHMASYGESWGTSLSIFPAIIFYIYAVGFFSSLIVTILIDYKKRE